MPLTLAQLSAVFTVLLTGRMVEQTNRAAVTLSLIRKVQGAGLNSAFTARGGSNTSTAYASGQDIDMSTAQSDVRSQGVLPWATYGGPVAVGDLEQAIAASMKSGNAPDDLLGPFGLFLDELMTRIDQTAELMNKELFAGTGTLNGNDAFFGFNLIAADGDNDIYAGMLPSTYDWWRGLVEASETARRPTKALFQRFFRRFIKKDAEGNVGGPGRKPTHCAMDPDVHLALQQDIEEKVQIQVPMLSSVPGPGGAQIIIPGGMSAFTLDGVFCIADSDCTPGTAYAWVDSMVEIRSLPKNRSIQPGVELDMLVKELVGNVEIDFGTYGVPGRAAGTLLPYIDFLAKTGLGTNAFQGVYAALVAKRRNAVGKLTNLDPEAPAEPEPEPEPVP